MMEKGYNGAGLKEILERASVPKGSFYNFFRSKEEFGVAIVEAFADWYATLLKDGLTDRRRPALSRLKTFFAAMRDHHAAAAGGCCLVAKLGTEVAELSPLIRSALKSSSDQWLAVIAQCLREAQAKKELAPDHDPEALAGFLHDAWEGALIRSKIEKNVKPLDAFLHHVFGRLLRS